MSDWWGGILPTAEDLGVLAGDGAADVGHHAGRQAELRRPRVEVTSAGAGAGADQQLVVLACRDELLNDRQDRAAAAVDQALAADLHAAGVRRRRSTDMQ